MHWATIIWSMIASACLTVGAIYFLVWYKNRDARAPLFFAVTAVSTAGWALCELWMMHSDTVGEQTTAIRLAQVPMFFLLVSITWFVWTYLGAGRAWLAWTIVVLRGLYVLPNFVMGQNPSFRELSVRRIDFLGESVTVTGGVTNPLLAVGQFGVVLVFVFVVDASIATWRRGDRRKAVVGGTIVFFLAAGLASSMPVLWANVPAPMIVSPYFLGLVAVMGYEVSRGVIRASQLDRELQASEAGRRESEARMSLAVDAADFGIWILDLPRNEIWASAKWRELFGFGPLESLEFGAVLERLHPDDRAGFEQAHTLAIAGADGGRYQTEYQIVLPDGTTRWLSSLGRVECGATGTPVLMRGASRNITARKRAEQETQLLRQEIAHAGRVSMMGQLASALAHEINQPLAAILTNAGAAQRLLTHASPDLGEVGAILADIRQDDERAGAVIDRMRGLLQRHAVDARRLDVGALVGEVAALVRVDAATRQVKLEVDVPGDLPPVRGDRVHLQQVLLNLILNGMDALNGAGPEDRRVSLTARRDTAQSVEISVSDAGPGISADVLAQIFEPFFTTKPNGMGMGLAISRTIVEAHGGSLWAENNHSGGAAFRFTLPIAVDADGD
jgi:two-component system, LuxR family, sensor kinase FixL